MVELVAVTEADKPVLERLLQLYRYDMAPYRGYELDEHGTIPYRYLDHYFLHADREACFVRHGGNLAGFTMTRALEGGERDVAEFFVVRHHRRCGVGARAAPCSAAIPESGCSPSMLPMRRRPRSGPSSPRRSPPETWPRAEAGGRGVPRHGAALHRRCAPGLLGSQALSPAALLKERDVGGLHPDLRARGRVDRGRHRALATGPAPARRGARAGTALRAAPPADRRGCRRARHRARARCRRRRRCRHRGSGSTAPAGAARQDTRRVLAIAGAHPRRRRDVGRARRHPPPRGCRCPDHHEGARRCHAAVARRTGHRRRRRDARAARGARGRARRESRPVAHAHSR